MPVSWLLVIFWRSLIFPALWTHHSTLFTWFSLRLSLQLHEILPMCLCLYLCVPCFPLLIRMPIILGLGPGLDSMASSQLEHVYKDPTSKQVHIYTLGFQHIFWGDTLQPLMMSQRQIKVILVMRFVPKWFISIYSQENIVGE